MINTGEEEALMLLGEIIKTLDTPLGLYIKPYGDAGECYKSSHPQNLFQAIRLYWARKMIWWGYKLLLNNSEVRILTYSLPMGKKK